ncbi:MAG: 4'-phosphopantetheinyl transferase superfamily protein [Acidobacteriia bacterium]|nr:4'-phosphopantetheinyl transferase superfamily protein [Terriglobia bacterium]
MSVYWLEQNETDVPAENQWLSAGETLFLGRMRFAKRRNDWRLGRWTAKHALATCLSLPCDLLALANIEIRGAASGAPEAFLFNQTAPVTISLSHRAGIAMCAVALTGPGIGCDLELIEPRSDAFIAAYLTAHEQVLVERTLVEERPLLVTLLWSAKESALKALHVGLRLDTNCMDVSPGDRLLPHAQQSRQDLPLVPMAHIDPDGWRPLHVRYSGEQVFYGWWRHTDHMVRTVVSVLPQCSPIRSLSIPPGNCSLSS